MALNSRRKLFRATLCVLVNMLIGQQANADQFALANLTASDVYVASMSWVDPPQPTATNGNSKIAEYRSDYWQCRGWARLAPGESFRESSPGWNDSYYYVETNGNRVSLDNTKERTGPILPRSVQDKSFAYRIDTEYKDFANELAKIFRGPRVRRTKYQRISGNHSIGGENAPFKIESREFAVNESSRDRTSHQKGFSVPGNIITWSKLNFSSRWVSRHTVTKSSLNTANVNAETEGFQVRLFGPREPGYLRYKLKIHYTIPNKNYVAPNGPVFNAKDGKWGNVPNNNGAPNPPGQNGGIL